MNIVGKILDASIVPGRDRYRVLLDVELCKGSLVDAYAEKSKYTGMLLVASASEVDAGHFDPEPGAPPWQPCPADFMAPIPAEAVADAPPVAEPESDEAPAVAADEPVINDIDQEND